MVKAAAWTCGLFALGGGVVHLFPGPLTEPLVLIALGTTMLLVSGRPTRAAPAPAPDAESSARVGATRGAR